MTKQNKVKRLNKKVIKLSIIIVSYNTQQLLSDCLDSLEKVVKEVNFEVIVVDNASSDDSVEMVKNDYPWVKLIVSDKNLGFGAGNNLAKDTVKGEYVLFLNSDTIVKKNSLGKTVEYMDENPPIGALTCKLVLPNGELDKDTRRSFPTPWVSLTHLAIPLDRIFPKSKAFSKYWYGYMPINQVHEIDVVQGAFFLTKKKILDHVGWFDEDYFLDGEDIDLSWKIKNAGWKNVYYPKVSIVHVKGASKGKNKKLKSKVSLKEKIKYRTAGVNSMELFYRKRLWNNYPFFINISVLIGIRILKLIRLIKVVILG